MISRSEPVVEDMNIGTTSDELKRFCGCLFESTEYRTRKIEQYITKMEDIFGHMETKRVNITFNTFVDCLLKIELNNALEKLVKFLEERLEEGEDNFSATMDDC